MLHRILLAIALSLGASGCAGTPDSESVQDDSSEYERCADNGLHANGRCDLACTEMDPECTDADLARAADVVAEIATFNDWLDDRDRRTKYCKMSQTDFVFYRGTNHLYWRDFAGDPRFATYGGPGTRIWLQGDLHAENYGSFENDRGDVIYDLNDFDETVVADYQWDLWRMAISLALIARENGGFSADEIGGLIDSFTESYLDTIAAYRGNDRERDVQFTEANTDGRLNDFLRAVEGENSRKLMLNKWTDKTDGVRTFDLAYDKLGPAEPGVVAAIHAQMASYVATTGGDLASEPGYFDVKDVARRLDAGTGSLGTPRYYVLIEGESADPDDDRILDVKRQGEPTAYPYLDADERAVLDVAAVNHAERTAVGYRALVNNADDHLGWMQLGDGPYSVRERSPFKESFPTYILHTEPRFENLAAQWGTILASGHARADRDYRSDIVDYSFDTAVDDLTDGSHQEFRAQVRDLAMSYADQVRFDHEAFVHLLAGPDVCE